MSFCVRAHLYYYYKHKAMGRKVGLLAGAVHALHDHARSDLRPTVHLPGMARVLGNRSYLPH